MKKSERRKLSPDGLPIDPREWLAEDWRDLHEAIERIKGRVRERHKTGSIERADYKILLRSICAMFATVQRENENDWMELACTMLNECLAALGDKDRLTYSRKSGCFEVKTSGDPSELVLVDLPCRRCGALVPIDADVLEETKNENVECPIWCEPKGRIE